MTNEIIILDDKRQITPTELFTPSGIDKILASIREKVKDFEPDMTTEKGRKEIASMAYKVARTKTALDNEGKKLTEEWVKQKSLVDSERKRVREELDDLRDKIRAPLDEWERLEQERIDLRKSKIAEFEACYTFSLSTPLEILDDVIDNLPRLFDFEWQEFQYKAKTSYEEAMAYVKELRCQIVKEKEKEQELEKLRKEKEECDRKDREEKIAKDAADKAKADAEVLAEKAAAEAKVREYKIEADKKAAIEAQKVAEQKLIEAKNEAKIAADKAVAVEREKVEAQKAAEAKAAAEREADKKYRTKINNEALRDLVLHVMNDKGVGILTEDQAKAIVSCIARGEIDHVSIKY